MSALARFFVLLQLLCLGVGVGGARPKEGQPIQQTAKVVFSTNGAGQLQALVIPYSVDGHFPRSGWTNCLVAQPELKSKILSEYAGKNPMEGFYNVNYRQTEQDKSRPILQYYGELIKLEPWKPAFKE